MLEWDADNYTFRPTSLLAVEVIQGDMIHASYEDFPFMHIHDTEIDIKKRLWDHYGYRGLELRAKTVKGKREIKLSRNKNTHKKRAKEKVRYAISVGKLVKPLNCGHCDVSSSVTTIHGHHEDYSKPLDVVWLCARCHHGLHRGKIKLTKESK